MRVVVLGATGYVGSRLVPALLDAGHEVVAASSSAPDPTRFTWGDEVVWSSCDVTDAEAVRRTLRDSDAVVYLVHSLTGRSFASRDRRGAENVRDEVRDSGVRRIVYLSGLVPTEPGVALSAHLASRLEVEEILAESSCDVLTLRAGVVIGAGSTSYEVMRQLASLLVVQPVPSWLDAQVQPVAISDVLAALVSGLEEAAPTGAVDLVGPDVLTYPELMAAYARAAGLLRLQVRAPGAPTGPSAMLTAALVTAPFWTVTALVESLRHSMVARPGHEWCPPDGRLLLTVDEALTLAVEGVGDEGPLPSDALWTRARTPLDVLPAPATVKAAARLMVGRLRSALG